MKKLLLCCFLAATFHAHAQEKDTTKIFDHYIGVQANQLLKQIINLNNSTVAVDNPYLLTYSLFSSKYKWGIEGGFGYNYKRSKDELSSTNQESKINDSFYRFGIGRKFHMGKRWEAALTADYVGSYQLDKTFSFSVTEFGNGQKDSTASVSTSLVKSKGEGLTLHLAFAFSRHVMMGTELSMYYTKTSTKSNVLVSDTFTSELFPEQNTYTISASNSDVSETDFEITLPVAIFLIVKF